MANWRKPAISFLLAVMRNDMMKIYRDLLVLTRGPRERILKVRDERLRRLLVHAYENVPYYHAVLGAAGVVEPGGHVKMANWEKIPFLTKDIIRREFGALQATDNHHRKTFENTSGGSTGEPVKFIQDRDYQVRDMASGLYMFRVAGKDVGEPELKIWGNQRDVYKGGYGLKMTLQHFLYNRRLINSFQMESRDMPDYLNLWNRYKPRLVWSYVDSLYEVARFIEKSGTAIHTPVAAVTTAGTLDDPMRKYLERVLGTKVINQYGSREVGAIASECPEKHGLHIMEWKQLVEIVNADGEACPRGTEGEIAITNFDCYAMPLIRFKIGDTGVMGECDYSCGYNLDVLEKVTGRVTDHFIRRDGSLFHGQYFGFMFYFTPWVKRFQFVQKDYDWVKVYIELAGEKDQAKLDDITAKVRLVLGDECRVEFEFVDEIKPSPSGKYLYTISEIYQKQRSDEQKFGLVVRGDDPA